MTRRAWTVIALVVSMRALAGCALEPPSSPDPTLANGRCGGLSQPCCFGDGGRSVCLGRLICTSNPFPTFESLCAECRGMWCGDVCVRPDDPANCGACGHACRRGESCVNGECAAPCPLSRQCVNHDDRGEFVTCDPPQSCYRCGVLICAPGTVCIGVSCQPVNCPGFWCEGACTYSSDRNCGFCGRRCAEGQRCQNNACVQTTCLTGLTVCANHCVDTRTDRMHCGGCDRGCDGTCEGGVCRCPESRVFCGPDCVDTSTDPIHCGGCDRQCATYAGFRCVSGACRCAEGRTVCDNACHDIMTDLAHCGACDHACPQGAACVAGVCACAPGQEPCSDGGAVRCVDTRSNSDHCGACGRACPAGEVCASGRCGAMCDPGLARCAGAGCRDLQRDARHCGACGAACPDPGEFGYSGACVAGRCTCAAGRYDCDGHGFNGCESTTPCA